MALTKTTHDIIAVDGLAQKIADRRLPPNKSAKALNFVKNKMGRLEKRLGLQPLSSSDPLGSGYSFNVGVNLGTWNNNVTIVGRGLWTPTGATVTALSQYSDDLGGTVRRGQMPDLKLVVDSVLADTPNAATNTTMCFSGDLAVMVWCDSAGGTIGLETGNVYWAAFETSTGDLVQAPTLLYSGKVAYLRLAIVGTTFVVCYNDLNIVNKIFCQTLTVSSLKTGFGWVNSGAIVTNMTNVAPSLGGTFDMRSASGDSTDFVLAYEVDNAGQAQSIICQRRKVSNPTTIDATFTADPAPTSTIGITAIGVRADTVTGRCAVAWCQPTNTTYPTPTSAPILAAAACVYPSMAFENGSSTNRTTIYTAAAATEPPAVWLDVVQCGSTGQLPGLCWSIVHSPWGAIWNSQTEGNSITQSFVNRVVTATPVAGRCARIITNQFEDGSNALTPLANTSGTNAGITPGVILASRGLEVNGIAYFLGWIPSRTQGSLVALAYDQMRNPSQVGNGYPMRPVGNLQVRTATVDPGQGLLYGHQSNPVPVGPNSWTGASEWQVGTDIYKTSYLAYFSGTIGQRLQPAYGALQTAPLTGYASAQWGSLTGIGGGLPMCFDGQSVFEQGFLYVPESVLVVMGTALGTTGPGPHWTNNTTDSYSWIFTWEQFDAQGNFHLSARSIPVTVTGAQITGAPGYFNPTFYIPTLGVTSRAVFGSAPSINTFSNALPPPNYQVTLGIYRTQLNGLVYFRLADRFFNNTDSLAGSFPVNKTDKSCFITFQDVYDDLLGNPAAPNPIDDGTHPLLYGDGSNGTPGSLDNFCPPSSPIMVRHKERLFVARGNQILFTKKRGEFAGPGYNEQVNAFFVGDATPIIALESMDDKLVIFKAGQLFAVGGDGPEDDGTGSSFQNPQPIPTDSGCSDPASIRSTPEGVYFMSSAGLRRLSRSLGVEYVGGSVEDELAAFPDVRSVVLYPDQNRVIFAVTSGDSAVDASTSLPPLGELIVRDYVLDAWTTAQVVDGTTFRIPAALAVANAPSVQFAPNLAPTLYMLTPGGVLWRERDPQGAAAPYFDNATYVSSVWQSGPIKQQDGARFRLWDVIAFGASKDPHGLVVKIAIDDKDPNSGTAYTWVWNSNTGAPSIAPGGSTPLALTRLRNYDGRLGAVFQIQFQDVQDSSSVTGQGFQVLGCSLSLGVAPGPYKLPPSSTQ